MATWKFILTDIQGNILGEIMDASARQVIVPLKSTPTAQFTIKPTNPLAGWFGNPNYDLMLKCYRNGVLQFCGPIVSDQEQGSDQGATTQVNAAGPFWRMNFRHLGVPSGSGGVVVPWSYGDAFNTYDLGTIAIQMIIEAHNQGFTGISVDSLTASSSGAVGPYYLQPVGDAILNLAAGNNSFEFMVYPLEPSDIGLGLPKIGSMTISPLIGTQIESFIFEYGAGSRNVLSYGNTTDRSALMTRGYMLQPAVTDYSDTLMTVDAAAEAARGVYGAVVDSGGVQYDVYRQLLLDSHRIVRRQARQVLNFVPAPSAANQPTVDYNVGDQVRCRVTQDGVFRFDAWFRIWGIQYDIDNFGNETPTLQLVPPTPNS